MKTAPRRPEQRHQFEDTAQQAGSSKKALAISGNSFASEADVRGGTLAAKGPLGTVPRAQNRRLHGFAVDYRSLLNSWKQPQDAACNLPSKADREGQRPRRALGAVAPLNSAIWSVDQRLNDLEAARGAKTTSQFGG
jgi:hypothetical protein